MYYICFIKRIRFILLLLAGSVIFLHNISAHQHLSGGVALSHSICSETENSASLMDMLLRSDTGGGHLEHFAKSDGLIKKFNAVTSFPTFSIFNDPLTFGTYNVKEEFFLTLPGYTEKHLSYPPNETKPQRGPPALK